MPSTRHSLTGATATAAPRPGAHRQQRQGSLATIPRRGALPDLPFRRYRSRPQTVRAVLLRESEAVPNPFATGEGYRGEAGTWKVFYGNRPDGSADVAIVDPQVFRETYEHVAGDRYRKKTTKVVAAAQLKAPLDLLTLEGPAHGEPGDWLLIGVQGHPYFNDNAYFRKHYVLAE